MTTKKKPVKRPIKKNLEIEKRLLLKRLPLAESAFSEIHIIKQYYGPSGRLRHVDIYEEKQVELFCNSIFDAVPITKYILTVKKSISKGVNEEKEKEISLSAFNKGLNTCTKFLSKTRYIKKAGKYKWEIDVINNCKLIVAEIEVDTKKELKTVEIPKYIKANMIAEITGIKEFSNFNLAEKWKKKK